MDSVFNTFIFRNFSKISDFSPITFYCVSYMFFSHFCIGYKTVSLRHNTCIKPFVFSILNTFSRAYYFFCNTKGNLVLNTSIPKKSRKMKEKNWAKS